MMKKQVRLMPIALLFIASLFAAGCATTKKVSAESPRAGVDEKDIVADYEVSHTYIKGFMADVSGSHYMNMEKLLAFLHKNYGGVIQYLDEIGVTDAVRRKLYKKFVSI